MNQIRVNVRTLVNNAKIRQEVRNGRQVMIIQSATMPDNIVMNKILYPAEEIANSFHTLEGTLAPIGHPMINDDYVPALHPAALTGEFQPFAVNENVRRSGGRVYLDKVVDIENAKASEKGRALLEAINQGDPIHTSTGIFMDLEPVDNGDGYEYIAKNMLFDHDCILLNQPGAATPEQGVGMMVNSDGQQIDVVNVDLPDDLLESVSDMLAEQAEYQEKKEQRKGLAMRLLSAIRSVLQSEQATGQTEENTNQGDDMSPEQMKEILDAVNAAKQPVVNADAIGEAVAKSVKEQMKPLVDSVNALTADKQAQAEAEKNALVQTVVNANVLTQDVAETMTVNQLKPLAEKYGKPGTSPAVNGNFAPNSDSETYDMPE